MTNMLTRLKSSGNRKLVLLFIFPLLLSLGILLLFSINTVPVCCDAVFYVALSQSIDTNGLIYPRRGNDSKGYLYPLLLSFFGDEIYNPYPEFASFYGLSIIVIMAVLYCFCFLLLRFSNVKEQSIYLVCFFCNPLLLSHLPYTLTESFVLPLFVLSVSFLVFILDKITKVNKIQPVLGYLFLAGILFGALVMLRPSNVILLAPLIIALCYGEPNGTLRIFSGRRITWALVVSLMLSTGFAFIALPQLAINLEIFNKFDFLITGKLGKAQIYWGLQNYKYGTFMNYIGTKHGWGGLHYATNFDVSEYRNTPLLFYVHHPLKGLALFC